LNNYAQPVAHSEDCKLARRYRQDTLYILKNLSLTRIPGSVSELFEQGQEAVEAVPGLSEAIGQAVTSVQVVRKALERTAHFLSMLKEQITDFLRYLAEQVVKQMGGLVDIAQRVFNVLKDNNPELKLTQAQDKAPTLTSTGTDIVQSSLWSAATGWAWGVSATRSSAAIGCG